MPVLKPWLAVLMLLGAAVQGHAQSFDCRKAESDTEWAICATPELGQFDNEVSATYRRYTDPSVTSSAVRAKAERMQAAWIHGRRDLCRGDVACLTKAYGEILGALRALPYTEPTAQTGALTKLAPHCAAPTEITANAPPSRQFAKALCDDKNLLEKARQIDSIASELQDRLSPAWRAAFDMQQAAIPLTPNNCPPAKVSDCVARVIDQRLQDVRDLSANLDKPLPDCNPADIAIRDSSVGDAGMSHTISAYLIDYSGTAPCRLRGYPTALVYDAMNKPQPDDVVYSNGTYFARSTGVPLPVTLSPQNRTAWFAIETASACDGPGERSVKVALPLQRAWLRTIKPPNANCRQVTVTPVAMISTLLSSIY
ncbi:lysozyme inhibitor LprI family protein [Pseudorhodoplanes sinuspersici]|nr:lysozyme inhibitor LprI family protein [Pseudorhodoplanes sinuspersici]RKE73407.1 uncharacterized protein DUF1311 [Pseudorhodoplanes sinuspersici]